MSLMADRALSLEYIFQVKDPDGYTAHISWQTVELEAGQGREFASTWLPVKEGRHILEAFVWQNIQAPIPLSSADVPRLELDVGPLSSVAYCTGTASCFSGTVTRIVDGDTLDVDNIRIRLALVDTPERGFPGYAEATAFTASLCPVGSTALVDEDDGQTAGSFGRMVAKVFCGDKVLNAELVYAGHAVILTNFCTVSEFAGESWAREYGC